MATAIKKCRVCGKEYEYCHTVRRVAGVFRWQDVACSPECGASYLAQIEASRAGIHAKNEVADKDAVVAEPTVTDFSDLGEYDNEDDWFADDFDDEAEETAMV